MLPGKYRVLTKWKQNIYRPSLKVFSKFTALPFQPATLFYAFISFSTNPLEIVDGQWIIVAAPFMKLVEQDEAKTWNLLLSGLTLMQC